MGPGASPEAIATIALRKQLEHDGVSDESQVRALVEDFGFAYVPEPRRATRAKYQTA